MSAKSVLIADDDAYIVRILTRRCAQLGLDVKTASDGDTTLALLRADLPDLAFLDVNMPAADGLTVCETLAGGQGLVPVPVIVLTGRSDHETIQRCAELGAHYVLKEAGAWDRVKPLLCRLLGLELTEPASASGRIASSDSAVEACEGSGPTVLLIDDDLRILKALKARLAGRGIRVLRATTGTQGYWKALKDRPDAILTDYYMPDGCGDYLLSRLREHPLTEGIPVIVITGRKVKGEKDHALERRLLTLGAHCVLTKPIDFERLLLELSKWMRVPNAATRSARSTAF